MSVEWTPAAVVQPGDRVMWWDGVLEIRSIEERERTYFMESDNHRWRCLKTDELMVIT